MSKLSVVLRASTGVARPNLRVRVKNVDTDAYVLDTDDDTLVDNGDGSYTSATDVSAMVYSVYTGDTATLVNGYEERFHPGEGESIGYEIGVDVQAYDLQLDQISSLDSTEVTRLGSLADIAYVSANLFPVMSSEGWSGMNATTARSASTLRSRLWPTWLHRTSAPLR